MDIDRLIDEIYKAYPMCKVKIVPCNDVPNMICITVGFYHHGDCLEFLHYVDVDNRQRRFYSETTPTLAKWIISRIKETLDDRKY